MTITNPTTHASDQYHLARGTDAGGTRFYLAGRPVHAGYSLELLVSPDGWLLGRYETTRDKTGTLQALFCFLLPSQPGSDEGKLIELDLPASACLRWPEDA